MLRLRCKARGGSQPLPGLTAHSRLRDMQAALAALTGVPAPAQRLLLGFPPRSLDLSDGERRLGDLGIHSGEGGRRRLGSAGLAELLPGRAGLSSSFGAAPRGRGRRAGRGRGACGGDEARELGDGLLGSPPGPLGSPQQHP